jgi:hypothetical protein
MVRWIIRVSSSVRRAPQFPHLAPIAPIAVALIQLRLTLVTIARIPAQRIASYSADRSGAKGIRNRFRGIVRHAARSIVPQDEAMRDLTTPDLRMTPAESGGHMLPSRGRAVLQALAAAADGRLATVE